MYPVVNAYGAMLEEHGHLSSQSKHPLSCYDSLQPGSCYIEAYLLSCERAPFLGAYISDQVKK
jgi:hypothetical protein